MNSLASAQCLRLASCSRVQICRSGVVPWSLVVSTVKDHRVSDGFFQLAGISIRRELTAVGRAKAGNSSSNEGDDDGVSLGTMKLPLDTDLSRFETLLFQWANSLSQGANVPLPVPLKVDKIPGGARLGFITVGDGETQVLVYIDCLVFPATEDAVPIFRAIRNGPLKDKSPPGEQRIMRSLLGALQKSVEIARL